MIPRFLDLLGVSRGDEQFISAKKSPFAYVLDAAMKSLLRLLGSHCIIPSLRRLMYRLSGVRIGKGVQINLNTTFLDDFVSGLIVLEDEVSVAPHVSFVASYHPNNSALYTQRGLGKTERIIVKKGAWLGVGSVVMPGIVIGEQAIVGANAVVTRDVEDFAIVAGVPARKVGDVREERSCGSDEKKPVDLEQ